MNERLKKSKRLLAAKKTPPTILIMDDDNQITEELQPLRRNHPLRLHPLSDLALERIQEDIRKGLPTPHVECYGLCRYLLDPKNEAQILLNEIKRLKRQINEAKAAFHADGSDCAAVTKMFEILSETK